EAGLRALEDQHLEQPALVVERHAPLLVVIGEIEGLAGRRPAAALRLAPAHRATTSITASPLRVARLGSYMASAVAGSAVKRPAISGRTRYSITVSPSSIRSMKNAAP